MKKTKDYRCLKTQSERDRLEIGVLDARVMCGNIPKMGIPLATDDNRLRCLRDTRITNSKQIWNRNELNLEEEKNIHV